MTAAPNPNASSAPSSAIPKSAGGFIAHLLQLGGYHWNSNANNWTHNPKDENRGALAELRSGLGKKPAEMARVHKHVVPYLPEKDYNDRWYYIIATLFGSFPKHRKELSVGGAFCSLKKKSDSMEARFAALLNADADDLDNHLRHAVSLLKTHDQPLDWFQLFEDLLQWDHPEGHVQLRWARDFYKTPCGNTDSQTTANSVPDTKKEI